MRGRGKLGLVHTVCAFTIDMKNLDLLPFLSLLVSLDQEATPKSNYCVLIVYGASCLDRNHLNSIVCTSSHKGAISQNK